MFCFQCQETIGNKGCAAARGACGKTAETAALQDLLVYVLKGISVYGNELAKQGSVDKEAGLFIVQGLFATITNTNFDNSRFYELIESAFTVREKLVSKLKNSKGLPDCAVWEAASRKEMDAKAVQVGVLQEKNEDIRSLKELIIYGLKGLSAYTDHAAVLGQEDESIYRFVMEALALTTQDVSMEQLVPAVLKTGEYAVKAMALLDKANTSTYGNPEITNISLGVRNNPGILVSGHDLRDLHDLLEQTKGTGVDVYTHSEMLPAHYYPVFKKYEHFAGNYGSSWWNQAKEFEAFNGPILMTTNCIVPVRDSYKDRLYTTGMAGYEGVRHIAERNGSKMKDFSVIIEKAKKCPPPTELETGTLVGGFAHAQVLALADKVVDAVKSGAIKRFVVMAGCDGRHKDRAYFTEVAQTLPKDTIILTAGCAKYRYNKLPLGDIGGIPRVLDAGQCNDSYSLAVTALKLKEVFGLDDVNDLPLSFDIAWYEQKAVTVLLALLYLGFKNIRLGPTLPAFLSPGVAQFLVKTFDIKPIGSPAEDVAAMMAGG